MEEKKDKRVYRDFSVTVMRNGFMVSVGCQHLVFSTPEKLGIAIADYLKDPNKTEEAFLGEDIRKGCVPPGARIDEPTTLPQPYPGSLIYGRGENTVGG